VKLATKIMEQTSKKDQSGQVVGQRVLALSSSPQEEDFWLIWTNGCDYYFLSSTSLQSALEIERRINSKKIHTFN
jgi:hypothetical protein